MNYYLSQLYNFSKLPPNTQLYKETEGHFTHNYIKGNKEVDQKLVDDISNFTEELIQNMQKCASNNEPAEIKFRKLIIFNRSISQAINGSVPNGGLNGLLSTYLLNPPIMEGLVNSIERLNKEPLQQLKLTRNQLNTPDQFPDEKLSTIITLHHETDNPVYCPEKNYTDVEWEEAIIQSSQLPIEEIGLTRYYGLYAGGLFYNRFKHLFDQSMSGIGTYLGGNPQENWPWWSEVGTYEGTKLYIGALPLIISNRFMTSCRNDLEEFQKIGIKAVLSVVEAFENNSEVLDCRPVKPAEYAEQSIKHLQIPTPDCETIYLELIERGVEFIRWNLIAKRPVYVHCKAGRGRSALTVMCFFIKYCGMTADDAFNYVKKHRPQAGFKETRNEWKTLRTFERIYAVKVS